MSYPISRAGNGGSAVQSESSADSPTKSKPRRALGIMQLEPRIMFDGAAAASVDHADSSAPASDVGAASAAQGADHASDNGSTTTPAATAPNQTNAPGPSDDRTTTPVIADTAHGETATAETARDVVFIDSRVPDLQTLINGAAPGVEVHVLDADRDGLQQIADYLNEHHLTDLSAIQIVSHGSQGALHLGSTELTNANMADHAQALADIGAALSADGDIALYGCDVASQQGQQFVAALSNYTGADIAASTDATGSRALGGNWTLEASVGTIETATPFSAAAQASYQHVLAETLTTTQVTILTGDTDGDGVVDPGETVTTTVTITNNSNNVDAINVQLNETLNGMTLVPGSVKITPIAFDDAGGPFTLTGNTPMRFEVAQLLANDIDPDGAESGLYISAVSAGDNGSVALFDNGTGTTADDYIVFTPNAGYEGVASFQYTIKDTQGLASVSTGVVTLTVTDPVWYVDSQNGNNVTGNGTYNNPFASLAPLTTGGSADALDNTNDTIFVYYRGTPYTSGIVLEAGQRLFGDGHALTVNGLSIGATAANTIINNSAVGITLATNNTISGISIAGTTNTAVGISDGGGTVGNLTISNTAVAGFGKAIDIDQGGNLNVTINSLISTNSDSEGVHLAATGNALTGSFTVTSGSISGSTGAALLIGDGAGGANTGGAVAVTFGASLAGGIGRTVDIQDRVAAAGAITLSGAIAHNVAGQAGIVMDDNAGGTVTFSNASKVISSGGATAVSLTDNTNTTINFTNGGLDIDTTTAIGFLVTGGGVVSVTTGANPNSITTTTGTALSLNNATIGTNGVTFATVSTNGAASAIVLDAVGQQAGSSGIDVLGGAIVNATSRGADINATSADVAIAANISTTAAGRSVEVTNSGSTVGGGNQIALSGAIDDNGLGIALDNNDQNNGATITFSGGLDIDSAGSNIGFWATNGGTVVVTGSNNSIVTTTGTALNVANTNIGLAGLTFRDISSNGASSGIVLNNTGTTAGVHGGLTVTGNAGAVINATGGTINASTGPGISLSNTRNVSLDHMTVQNGLGDGILGSSVTNFSLTNSTVTNNGDQLQEHGIQFDNLFGTGTFTNLTISNNETSQVEIINNTAGASGLSATFDGVSISSTGLASAPTGLHGIRFETQGAASADLIVQNGSFNNLFSNSIHATNEGTGTLELTVATTDFNNTGASAINLAQNNSGTVRFYIHDNDTFLRGANNGVSHVINVNQAGGTPAGAVMEGRIANNIIGNNSSSNSASTGGYGVRVMSVGSGTTTVQIDNNNIQGTAGGINITMGEDTNPAHTMNATISGNIVLQTDANSVNGIYVNIGTSSAGPDAGLARIDMYNNNSTMAGAAAANFGNAIYVETRFNTSIRLPGYSGGSADMAAVQTYLDVARNNNATGGIPWTVAKNAASGGYLNTSPPGSAIPLPTLPSAGSPLLAAEGGVEAAAPPATADTTPPEQSAVPSAETPAEPAPTESAETPTPSVVVDDGLLSQAELDAMVEAGLQRWAQAGLSVDQLAALREVDFTVSDMSGWYLGSYQPNLITLDLDAAGHGWYIDTTPLNDSEFGNAITATQLQTDQNGAPAGHFDLLTTIMHEMGHALGLGDSYTLDARASLMYGYLVMGERRLASQGQADGAITGSIHSEEFLGAPVVVGTLPAGKSVQVIWEAVIDPQTNQLIVNPVNQGTVSADNGVGFPDQTTNTVTTVLDTLTLGSKIWNDVNGNGVDDGETGLAGVTLTLFADTNDNNEWDAGDIQIATTTTNAGGNYSFTGLAEGDYIVRVDAGNFLPGGPLAAFTDTSAGFADPDDNNGDGDDNGGPLSGGLVYTKAISLNFNQEPTAGTGNDTNNTLDIGFITNVKPDLASVAAAAAYTENAPGTTLSSTLTVSDGNDANLASATIKINDFVTGDVLSANVGATGIVATYDGAGLLTLTGPASTADFQQVLRTVAYSSTSENPTVFGGDTQRTIQWQLNDGQPSNNLSDLETTTVTITAQNDAAVLSSDTRNLTETNLAADISSSGTLTISDVDSATTFTAQPGTAGSYGTFAIAANGAWTYTASSAHNEFVAGTTYTDAFNVTSADGTVTSVTINILGTNDPATLSSDTRSLTETNAAADISSSGTLTISDVDSAATFTAQPSTAGTYGTFAVDANGAWTYTASSAHNEFVAGTTYTDTFNVTSADGTVTSVTINILGSNDPATLSSDTRNLTETNLAADISSSGTLTVSDVDNPLNFTAQPGTAGAYGTFAIDANGAWTYTASSAHNEFVAGTTYTDAFSVSSADGTLTSVTINIIGTEDASVLSSDIRNLTETNAAVDISSSGTLTLNDPDSASTFTAQPGTAGAYGTFAIDANGAWTYTASSAHNEFVAGTTYTDTFDVTSTDGVHTSVVVNILGTNDPATLSTDTRNLTETNLAANISSSGTLTISDVDSAATFTAQPGTAGSYGTFAIAANGAWTYTASSAHNEFVAGTTYTDTFSVSSADGTVTSVTINILGTNDAAVLSSDTRNLTETNAAADISSSGTLTVSDVDSAATFTAQPGTAGSYGTFAIDANGSWTYTASSAHNEFVAGTTYMDTFSVTSADGTVTSVTINILGTNDAAVLSSDTRNLTETNAAADISSSGTLTVSDVDSAATFTAQPGTAGSYGIFAIDANGAWTYTASSAHNEFVAGITYTDTFSVTSADGTVTSVTINILGTNDAAVLSSDSRNLTETNAAADISSSGTLTISDVDSATTFTAQPGTAGSYGTFAIDANGVWTYTASSAHNEFVAGTTYTDTFSVSSTDGTVTSVTINILGTNDAAVLSSDTRNLTETNAAADISSSGTLTISDADSAATFMAQPGTAGSYGTFTIATTGAWTYTASSAHNEFVAGTTYTDTFSVTSADGTVTSVTIDILGTNDAAVITGNTTGVVVEAGGANNNDINTPLVLGDVDSTDIDGTADAFQPVGSIFNPANSTYGSYVITSNGGWGYLLDNNNAVVQALNVGNTLTDTFTVHTLDGTAQVVTITINGDNDAPVVESHNTISYNANNGGSVLVNPNVDLSDVDSTVITGATISISAGRDNGDRLLFTNQNGITGSFNNSTGVLTLTGNASVATYEAALKTVRFTSTSDDSGPRTVSWRATDGMDNSAADTTRINVRGIDRHHHRNVDGHYDDNRGNSGNFYSSQNGLITNVSTGDRWNGSIGNGYFYVNANVQRVGDASTLELQTPVAALADALGGDPVQTTATLLDGKPLPDWLKFDPQTGIMTGRLPANIVASIQPNVGQATDDNIVTGSIGNGNGNQSAPTHGTISIQITSRDAQGNIATTIFTIDLSNKQSWLPGDRDARRYAAIELQRALAGSSVVPTTFMAPALDAIEDTLAGPDEGAGRVGLSQQLDGHGWRGLHADRMALIASLQQSGAGWR